MKYSQENITRAMEVFIQKEKGDGKRGPFYNKKQPLEFDINDDNLFKNAVWQGYLDASRTFSGIKNTKVMENNAFDNLSKKIQEYFKGETEFLHDQWCLSFMEDLKNFHEYTSPRYGQAQKVVNMAFKYLLCCNGAKEYYEKFKPCHMPLDQYTLAWLFSEGFPLYQGWSNCSKECYEKIQEGIKSILDQDILKKEFVIWEVMKKRVIEL